MVGTVTEVLEMKREQKALEEISDFEMRHLPRGLRIDIPLRSTIEARKAAQQLRQFADYMEKESRRNDLTPVQILWNIWRACRGLRYDIDEICKTKHVPRD